MMALLNFYLHSCSTRPKACAYHALTPGTGSRIWLADTEFSRRYAGVIPVENPNPTLIAILEEMGIIPALFMAEIHIPPVGSPGYCYRIINAVYQCCDPE